jgi:hypothetical protein
MRECLSQKFADPTLRARLLETGDRDLIEENTWNDRFWGVCRGHGGNHLGKLLMAIRTEAQAEARAAESAAVAGPITPKSS